MAYFFYINDVDRTGDIEIESISINNQIQQRTDSMDATVISGNAPTENQEVRFFVGDTIASAAGATITLNGYFERSVLCFYPGQILFIRIHDADEEKCTVLTYNETTLTLVLTAAPSGSVVAGDKIGELRFGGVVTRPKDRNVVVSANLEYDITAVDYTKVFDKKIVADTWENVDSRYIINSFVNSTVNYNQTLDSLSYINNTAIQAEWIESGTGSNPTVESSDYLEGTSSGVFSWTGSGTATFSATPTAVDVSNFTGLASGTPTKGALMVWIKPADYTKITSIKLRVGSDASNYAEVTLDNPTKNDWQYRAKALTAATIVGTPVWTAADYIALVIAETGTTSMQVNGFRLNASKSFTLYNVESTPTFTDFRSPQLKPTSLIQTLAKAWRYIQYIDYERDIHFVDQETILAPYALTDTSENYTNLKRNIDQSQLGNRVIVRGGEQTSTSVYSQVIPGDNSVREWILKNKFNNLTVRIDNNSLTAVAAAGTNTTNIKIVAHGFVSGDHIINRTRSNAVREITVVDVDNFTVATVASQTSGDTISHFDVATTIGIEGITDETTVNYVYNSNEKSVRATALSATLPATSFIRFSYNERVPIQVQKSNAASIDALKAMGYGDGIFDLDPITDRNITDIDTALALANAKLADYADPIIQLTFQTDKNGLKAGQQLPVQDSIRGVDTSYLIQSVRMKQKGGQFSDYFTYEVTAGTTLFGAIEFYQKLMATKDAIDANVDDIVDTYVDSDEKVTTTSVDDVAAGGGFETATGNEDATTDDSNLVTDFTPPWKFEPSVGQPLATRFDLSSFS